MSTSWMTKYGRRSISNKPPTLEEALFAAEGLTDDPAQQVELAAELMHMPVEKIQANAKTILKAHKNRVHVMPSRSSRGGTVVVERKPAPRVLLRRAG